MHRGLWAIPCAALIIWWLGQYKDVWQAVASKRNLAILTLTGAIIVFNWGFYVWSIEMGRTLEASLGYYINPLMNVVMGYLFLGERFNRLQMVALLLALIAVLIQTFAAGVFPWLGLMLATSFCIYGFLRKTIAVGPTQGFFIEVCIIAIPLLLTQVWLVNNGEAHFGGTLPDTLLLMGLGLMTTSALVFFALSIKLLRYSTAGLLQYISPTLVFLTAVFVFGEPMDSGSSCPSSSCGLALRSIPGRRSATNETAAAKRKHWFSMSGGCEHGEGCWHDPDTPVRASANLKNLPDRLQRHFLVAVGQAVFERRHHFGRRLHHIHLELHALADETFFPHVLEQRQIGLPVVFDVAQDDRLGVLVQLRPGRDLGELFQRADAAGQCCKSGGMLEHRHLALMHALGDDQFVDAGEHAFLAAQEFRDDAGHVAARFEHGPGHFAHEADAAAAINQANA